MAGKTWFFVRSSLVTGLVVSLFLTFDFFVPQLIEPPEDWFDYCVLGAILAQLNLLAVWAALAPGNIMLRISWSALTGVMLWYALVAGERMHVAPPSYPYATYPAFSHSDALHYGLLLLAGAVVAQVPMWAAAWAYGWKLGVPALQQDDGQRSTLQFRMRHLLLGIVLLSLALAPARWVLPNDGGRLYEPEPYRLLAVVSVLAAFNLLIAFPSVWGARLRFRTLLWAGVLWLLYCLVLSRIEFVVFSAIMPTSAAVADQARLEVFALNVSLSLTIFVPLMIFRVLGFRLLRGKQTPSPAGRRAT